jgi:hypothetical protein
MEINCKVRECRFNKYHTTRGHRCGTCYEYGHGQLECYDNEKKELLKKYWNDQINNNERCNFANCKYWIFHKKEGHLCDNCKEFGHNIDNCFKIEKKIKCPICRTDNNIKISQKKIIGLEEICCICMDNKVEIYFNGCGHVCLCFDCFIKS